MWIAYCKKNGKVIKIGHEKSMKRAHFIALKRAIIDHGDLMVAGLEMINPEEWKEQDNILVLPADNDVIIVGKINGNTYYVKKSD